MKRSMRSALSIAIGLVGLLCASQSIAQANLNGEWRSNSGGIYDIWQRGARVVWEAHSPDGYTWTHRFEGRIRGNFLRGFFQDHPPGRYNNAGQLQFELSGNTLYRVNQTRAFTDTELTYIGPVPSSAYAQSAPQQQYTPPQQQAQAEAEPASPDAVREIDAIVAEDAATWISNRYDRGSIYDAQIEWRSADNTQARIFARYTYNGGTRGWVRLKTANGHLACIEFHDFAPTCRALGASPSIALVKAGAGLAAAVIVLGVASHGSGGNYHGSSETQTDPSIGYKFSRDNAEHQANCPGTPGPCP